MNAQPIGRWACVALALAGAAAPQRGLADGVSLDLGPDGVEALRVNPAPATVRLRAIASGDLAGWAAATAVAPPDGWLARPEGGWPGEEIVIPGAALPAGDPAAFYRAEFDTADTGFVTLLPVGDVGNPEDPRDGDRFADGDQHFGAVDHLYFIGRAEVTNGQYVAFLNSVAASDLHALFKAEMGTDPRGGVSRAGSDGAFTYSARPNMANKPVNFVSFWDACRFCNWLHNGMPSGPQTAGTTETGAYDLTGPEPELQATVARLPGARFFLPSEDEWYKAGYYDPGKGGSGGYWLYPTRSDSAPNVASTNASGDITSHFAAVANYDFGADWNGLNGNVTTVASGGAGSAGHYGAHDMAGNVYEWIETPIDVDFRVLRGGSWFVPAGLLESPDRDGGVPTFEGHDVGFRVASY
jgi:formylglycine-generating enzyme required for sulfatase activity